MTIKEKIEWIYNRHDVGVNQQYSDYLPYSFHLKMVLAVGERFKHLLSKAEWDDVRVALAGHDLIEDARLSYNDVNKLFGKRVADIIYACTDEKGHTRGERHSDKFFLELSEERLGVFVKLCDIIANSTFSRVMGDSMFERYKKELNHISSYLYKFGEYDEMWEELKIILK